MLKSEVCLLLFFQFCEDRSENIEFNPPRAPLDFQPVLCSVKKYVLTSQHTHSLLYRVVF